MVKIILSPEHGVNPTVPKCFYCGKDKNEVILAGKLPGDQRAPRGAVWDHEPCDRCRELMQRGVILISVRDGETGDNPYRTGGWIVVVDAVIRRFAKPEHAEQILRSRVCFMPDEVWDMLSLPRGGNKADIPFVGLPKEDRH